MTEKMQVYKCEKCGNIVKVLHKGAGELVCCGVPMKLMEEQTADQSKEKHVPVLKKTEKGYKVIVGSTEHPMLENHFIEWIEVITETGACRKFLNPVISASLPAISIVPTSSNRKTRITEETAFISTPK